MEVRVRVEHGGDKNDPSGFEVTIGDRSDRFALLEQALVVAHERLRRAQELRELSTRIE